MQKSIVWAKRMAVLLVLAIGLHGFPAAAEEGLAASPPVRVFVEGRWMESDVPPVIESGTTLIPFRALLETLGAQVLWDGKNRLVLAVLGDKAVKMKVGSDEIEVNDAFRKMPLPVQIIAGRTMIPLRTVCEALGFRVSWDPAGGIITVMRNPPAELAIVDGQNLVQIDLARIPGVSEPEGQVRP